MYPELEALNKLYEKENYSKITELCLIGQHHLRCVNYEALRGNYSLVTFHYNKYKEKHIELYGY